MPAQPADPVPPCTAVSRPFEIAPITTQQVRFRVLRLGRVFQLSNADIADLEQDLWLEIVRAMKKFDPNRSLATTFAQRVMELWYCDAARRIRRGRAQRRGRAVRLAAKPLLLRDTAHLDLFENRLSLEAALLLLTEEQQTLVQRLRVRSVAEIAAEDGVHRGTVYRQLVKVRQLLRRVLPDFCHARNTSTTSTEGYR